MENQLFRQKSLERIFSPEEVRDYLRVTSPRLWMILGAVLILAAGFIVYASTATNEITIDIKVEVERYPQYDENGEETGEGGNLVFGYIPVDEKENVDIGMEVRIGEEKGKVAWVSVSEDRETASLMIEMEHEDIGLETGTYDAVLVLEETTPFSFLHD